MLPETTVSSSGRRGGSSTAQRPTDPLPARRRATTLAWRSRAASSRYALAEWQAGQRVTAARLITGGVISAVRDLGRGFGWLEDGTMDLPRQREVPHCSVVHVDDIASLMTSQSLLSGQPVVRIIEVPQPDGSSAWIVQIPGTITVSPVAGSPHDGTATPAMLDESAVLARSALWALAEARPAAVRWDPCCSRAPRGHRGDADRLERGARRLRHLTSDGGSRRAVRAARRVGSCHSSTARTSSPGSTSSTTRTGRTGSP